MKTIGQIAFEAYNDAKGGVTYDGKPIPPWSDVGEAVRSAWEAAAHAVAADPRTWLPAVDAGARHPELATPLAPGMTVTVRVVHPFRPGYRHPASSTGNSPALCQDCGHARDHANHSTLPIVPDPAPVIATAWIGTHRGREVSTTDGKPPELPVDAAAAPKPLGPDGQHRSYWVLSEAERARGFVRPVRTTYLHTRCGVTTTMGRALAETYASDPKFYSHTFCIRCGNHWPVAEFTWDGTEEVVGS